MSQPSPSRAARRIATCLERPDPQGDGALHGRRIEPDVAQPVPAALEGDEILAPEPAGARPPALPPGDPRSRKFSFRASNSTAFQPMPMPRRVRPPLRDVELGRLLGDERGLALREDEDRGRELDPLGDRREVGEEEERLVEHPVPRIETSRAAVRLGCAPQARGRSRSGGRNRAPPVSGRSPGSRPDRLRSRSAERPPQFASSPSPGRSACRYPAPRRGRRVERRPGAGHR